MPARLLTPRELVTRCDPASLGIEDTTSGDGRAIVGQQRARAAIDFGIAMARGGHHLFVMGPRGSGKQTLVRDAIAAQLARGGGERFDWVYVNNFEQPHKPLALRLPQGRGTQLRQHMRTLVQDLRTMIPATFESEEYANAVERLNNEYKERAEQAVLAVGEDAQRQGLVMVRTPVGLSFAPRKPPGTGEAAGEVGVLSPQEFEALPQAERERLQAAMSAAQEQLARTLRSSVQLRKELADRLRTLNRSMTLVAVEHVVDEVKALYTDLPDVGAYLDAVRADVIDSADSFRAAKDDDGSGAGAPRPVGLRGQPDRRHRRQRRHADRDHRPSDLQQPDRPCRPHRAAGHAADRLPPDQGRRAAPGQWRLPADRRGQAAGAAVRLGRVEARAAARRDPHRIGGRSVQPGLDDAARADADPAQRQGGAARRALPRCVAAGLRPGFRQAVSRRRRSVGRVAARAGHAARTGARARRRARSSTRCCRPARRRWHG